MKKTAKLFLFTLICIAAVAALAWAPTKYQWAEMLFYQGRYDQAKQIYASLSYRDSQDKSSECSYRLAQGLFLTGNYRAAKQIYESIPAYKMAGIKAAACEFMAMDGLGGHSGRATVEEIFLTLDEEQSARDLLLKCNYILASKNLAVGQVREALRDFELLGEYADSGQRVQECYQVAFELAVQEMNTRSFETALDYFDCANRPEQSALYEKYCQLRLESNDIFEPSLLLTEKRLVLHLVYGDLYYYTPSYIYVPSEINAQTKFMIYYPGGRGEGDPMLFEDIMYEYLWNYAPNAVVIFRENSGVTDIGYSTGSVIALANQVAAECGIGIHDLVIAGSSNGCYTALHAAAAFYTDNYIAAQAVITLDTGVDWADASLNMYSSERESTARAGTKFYLFEQYGDGLNIDAIYDLVASGNDVTAVYCSTDGHNEITQLAFIKGVFSWAMGEYEELDADEYRLYPLKL